MRWLPQRGPALALYAASIAILFASPLGQNWPFVDLAVYRAAGRGVLHGAALYDLRFPGALAFTYTPFAGLLFTSLPLAALRTWEVVSACTSIALIPVTLRCALRLPPISELLSPEQATRLAFVAAAAVLWSEPAWSTLHYGQIDILIAALVLYDLAQPDRRRAKGVGIGLATGIKLTPAIFVVYLLLTRRVRAAAVSAATLATTIAIGYAVLPRDALQYWGGAFVDPGRVGRMENATNQSLRGAWARMFHSLSIQSWWLCSAILVGIAGTGLAVRAGRRGADACGFAFCTLTGLLTSPVSWTHHWFLAMPALVICAVELGRRGSRWGAAAVGGVAVIACTHMPWWVPIGQHRHAELHLIGIQLVWSNAYVAVAVVALLAATWHALVSSHGGLWSSGGRRWRSQPE